MIYPYCASVPYHYGNAQWRFCALLQYFCWSVMVPTLVENSWPIPAKLTSQKKKHLFYVFMDSALYLPNGVLLLKWTFQWTCVTVSVLSVTVILSSMKWQILWAVSYGHYRIDYKIHIWKTECLVENRFVYPFPFIQTLKRIYHLVPHPSRNSLNIIPPPYLKVCRSYIK